LAHWSGWDWTRMVVISLIVLFGSEACENGVLMVMFDV
jgi:hypothetical protein